MILLIDNYDSFVHNLERYIVELNRTTLVKRNDAITLADIEALKPSHIILSPGPGTPEAAGICIKLIQHFYNKIPILGVCLGHQAIGAAFGARITRATHPMHGMSSTITIHNGDLFNTLPNPLTVGRYHSLIIAQDHFPPELMITATSLEEEIMAIQHRTHPVYGVQFHPESILTEAGHTLLQNFIIRTST